MVLDRIDDLAVCVCCESLPVCFYFCSRLSAFFFAYSIKAYMLAIWLLCVEFLVCPTCFVCYIYMCISWFFGGVYFALLIF